MAKNVEHGDTFLFEIINMLGKVPTQVVLDKIEAEVSHTKENWRTLVEALELAGAGTARTAHIDDVQDLRSVDAAHQLKHRLQDRLREMEGANG